MKALTASVCFSKQEALEQFRFSSILAIHAPAVRTMAGLKCQCEPLAQAILAKVEVGLSAQRFYQDLVEENCFADSYESVKRFVPGLRTTHPKRVWRLECQPGEELQLDFGLGASIDEGQGKTRRSWILRLVSSYSHKGYSEGLYRQDTDDFLRCLENRLRSFGALLQNPQRVSDLAGNCFCLNTGAPDVSDCGEQT